MGVHTPIKSRTPRRDTSGNSISPPRPVQSNDIFSQNMSAQAPALPAPLPRRLNDMDTEDIRAALVNRDWSLVSDAEARRPDYLTRAQRTPSTTEVIRKHRSDQPEEMSTSGVTLTGLGIAVTPTKGRRLKLFQETSEESFEESLMVNGYGYGGTVPQPSDQLSQHTLDWLQQRSPGVVIPKSHLMPERSVPEPLTDKEVKKRKRLDAFKAPTPSFKVKLSKLLPGHVEGRGKVLLSTDEHEAFCDASEQDSVKRSGSRRKRKGSPSKRKSPEDPIDTISQVIRPNWPDAEFPWCVKASERAELLKEDQDQKMKWIEKYLDGDTDEEESEEEFMPSATWGKGLDQLPVPTQRGRGRLVSVKVVPESKRRMFFPSDPADAMAALLSKRAVRASAKRRAEEREAEENLEHESDAEEVCICGRKNNSSGLVQCDDCEKWFHLRCVGIKNVEDLGGDEDPWYCSSCLEQSRGSLTPELDFPSSEPIIVPTDDDRGSISPSKDPLFFEGSFEQSPLPSWTTSAPPTTPVRSRYSRDDFQSSSSPSKGPYTPRNLSSTGATRVYTTPGYVGGMNGTEAMFDPTSTPSRGIKLGTTFVTPKNTSAWSNNRASTGGLFHTPANNNRAIAGSSRAPWAEESGGAGSSSPLPRYHNAPLRRKGAGARVSPGLSTSSRQLFETPVMLTSRNAGYHLDESPVVRSVGKKRMREEADIGDGDV